MAVYVESSDVVSGQKLIHASMMDEFINFSKRNGFSIPDVTPICQGDLMTSVVKWLLILLNASSLRIKFLSFFKLDRFIRVRSISSSNLS